MTRRDGPLRGPAACGATALLATLAVVGCPRPLPPPPLDGGGGTDSAAPITECNDGMDNDGDGFVDYPAEPGCTAPQDPSEQDPVIPPACWDGVDNDGDGAIDYPVDPGCMSAGDNQEQDPPACSDGLDNDGDGAVDFPDDPGCTDPADTDETNPECSDGIDNDGDGFTDFPNDPDCESVAGESEQSIAECMDSIDNDADALVDWPVDPGCTSDTDDDEFNPPICVGGVVVTDITGSGSNMGTLSGMSLFDGSCGGGSSPEVIFWANPTMDLESMTITATGVGFTPLLYVQTFCGDSFSEIACSIDSLTLTNVSAGGYFIFLDGSFGSGGSYTIDVSGIIAAGQPCDPASTVFTCNTTLGFACADPGGTGSYLCSAGQCSDGIDNDGDGNIDYPNDPGCTSPSDNDEANPAVLPGCADGIDNDGDGQIDYPADSGCGSAADDDETGCLYDWNDGTLAGWTVSNTCATVGWGVDSFRSTSPPNSLYYGNPATRTFDCSGLTNSGTATSPLITLPAFGSEVTFEVFIDTEPGTTFDLLTLWVLPAAGPATMVWDRNDFPEGANGNTMGMFIPQIVDLSAYDGQSLQLELRFDTADGIGNSTEGDYVDDIFVTGSCP